jgi:phosphoribosylanthranilate isomerase
LPEIKFCGITRTVDAELAAELGARYVGVIFARSVRLVSEARALEIARAVQGRGVRCIGVFDDGVDRALEVAERLRLDGVQLHGPVAAGSIAAARARFGGMVWAVVPVGSQGVPAEARSLFEVAHGVVLDTRSARGNGGTGEAFDWASAGEVVPGMRAGAQLVVAGGLRPDNVGRAIAALGPDVVDVSSGVETGPGVKDPSRMRAFVEAVHADIPR